MPSALVGKLTSLQSWAFFDEISDVHEEKAGVLECNLNIYGAQCTGSQRRGTV